MKYENAFKKLSRFGFTGASGAIYFWTRNEKFKNRQVKLINQDGRAIALPLFVESDGEERVVFHAKTIKSLVDFLEGK